MGQAGEPLQPRFKPCPWQHLETPSEVEHWIDEHNRSMQENIGPAERGYGVRFSLAEGGEIYLHTADGAVLLDVDADAAWVAPLISAASGMAAPAAQVWILPDDKLVQLVLGLSSLIATSTLVVGHDFGRHARAKMR